MILRISKETFSQFNENKIQYCHWKSNEHLMPGLNGETDLDVLVSPTDKSKCETVLHNLSYLQCISQYGAIYPKVDDWIGFDEQTGKLIHIHLHYKMITGHKGMKEFTLPWDELCLETRVLDPETNVYIMDPNLEIITLYCRICLKKPTSEINRIKKNKSSFRFSDDVKKEIDYLKARIDYEVIGIILRRYFSNPELILKYIKKDELNNKEFTDLYGSVKKDLVPYCDSRFKYPYIKEVYYKYALFARKVLYKKTSFVFIYKKVPVTKRGLTVAFIGQDGAGKSTVVSEIGKWLSWKIDARNFYLGSGENYRSISKALLQKLGSKGGNAVVKLLRGILLILNYNKLSKSNLKRIKSSVRFSQKGGIALFDRYPQSDVIGLNDGPKIRDVFGKKSKNGFFGALINLFAGIEEKRIKAASTIQPDLVFKLILPVEESMRRKPTENEKIVSLKHDFILNWDLGKKQYQIDACQEYDKEILEIKKLIWENLLAVK